jgi:hypothetical protein
LKRDGHLKPFQYLGGLLIALDGTQYFDSHQWKTENENHNVLKTKGYHLEHNFGHGQEHLAACLLTLNLLAFLFHTVLHLTDLAYQQIRHQRGTRKGFFQDILSLTKYLLFESWPSLISCFMALKLILLLTLPRFLNLELLMKQ